MLHHLHMYSFTDSSLFVRHSRLYAQFVVQFLKTMCRTEDVKNANKSFLDANPLPPTEPHTVVLASNLFCRFHCFDQVDLIVILNLRALIPFFYFLCYCTEKGPSHLDSFAELQVVRTAYF